MKKILAALLSIFLLNAIVWGTTCILVSPPPPAAPKPLASFLHDGEVVCLAFSPDGRYLLAGSKGIGGPIEKFWQGRVKVWDAQTLKYVSSFDLPRWVSSMSFSPKGRLLAVACGSANWHSDKKYKGYEPQPGETRILAFPELKEKKKLELGDMADQVTFSRDGKFLAASSFVRTDQTIFVWSVSDWKKLRAIESPRFDRPILGRAKLAIARASDNSFLIVGKPADAGGRYRITQVRPNRGEQDDKTLVTFDMGHTPPSIESISCYWDNKRLIYHTGGGVRIVYLENGKEETPETLLKAEAPISKTYTVSEDGKWLALLVRRAMGGLDRGQPWVVLWDLTKQEQLAAWAWPEERVPLTSIAISPDKKMLAVGTAKSHFIKGVQHSGEVELFDISKVSNP